MISEKIMAHDFKRDVWCVLGLPIDHCSIEDTCEFIEDSIAGKQKKVLSTVNLNFITTSLKNLNFKKALIRSEVSVVDGSPLLWTAKFLGLPLNKKVSGATLVEHILLNKKDKKYKIFFFGGREGVAEKAHNLINNTSSTIRATGFYYPGYGTIEDMSNDQAISSINKKDVSILLLALGAEKGVLWIDKNKHLVNANILSHVGITINIIAGNIKRAPVWMQNCGLEWIWRASQQPILLKRYLHDGSVFVWLLLTRLLPLKLFLCKYHTFEQKNSTLNISTIYENDLIRIKIQGTCNIANLDSLRECLKMAAFKNKNIEIDLTNTEYIDNSFLGLLLILFKYQTIHQKSLKLINASKRLKFILKMNLLTDLFPL